MLKNISSTFEQKILFKQAVWALEPLKVKAAIS